MADPTGYTRPTPKATVIKNKRFALEIVKNGKTASEAYMLSRGSRNKVTAIVEGSKLLSKPHVQQEISRQLESVGLSDNYTDQSMQTLLDSAIANAKQTKPADGIAIIRMINELRDRFPAKRTLNANLNLEQETMNNQSVEELKQQLKEIQEQNRLLLDRLE